LPNEKPPQGFTWDDYDNVQISDRREDDADGEDGGEWGVVENKRARKLLHPYYHLFMIIRHCFSSSICVITTTNGQDKEATAKCEPA